MRHSSTPQSSEQPMPPVKLESPEPVNAGYSATSSEQAPQRPQLPPQTLALLRDQISRSQLQLSRQSDKHSQQPPAKVRRVISKPPVPVAHFNEGHSTTTSGGPVMLRPQPPAQILAALQTRQRQYQLPFQTLPYQGQVVLPSGRVVRAIIQNFDPGHPAIAIPLSSQILNFPPVSAFGQPMSRAEVPPSVGTLSRARFFKSEAQKPQLAIKPQCPVAAIPPGSASQPQSSIQPPQANQARVKTEREAESANPSVKVEAGVSLEHSGTVRVKLEKNDSPGCQGTNPNIVKPEEGDAAMNRHNP